MIRVSVLASGSKGNAVYVEVDGQGFLLDCGLNYKTLKKRLDDINRDPSWISKIFISHSHGDHIGGVDVFQNRHQIVPVYFGGGAASSPTDKFKIEPFLLAHDEPCCGFRITDTDGNVLVYSPDSVTIPCDSLRHYLDASIIIQEFNYDTSMLLANTKYPDDLRIRISETHMTNESAGDLLEVVGSDKLEHVICFHLSESNNSPELAKYEAIRGLKAAGCSPCQVTVYVAKQNEVLPLITVM